MSSIRYSSSFIISSLVYIVIVAIYFNIIDIPKPIDKPKEHRVKIAIIIPPKIEPKPIIKSTPPPTMVVPKPKPKKIIKKSKHRIKKIIKKPKHKRKKIIKKPKHKIKKIIKKSKHKIKKIIKYKKVVKLAKVVEVIEPYIKPISKEVPMPIQSKIITRPKPIIRPKPIKRILPSHKENLNTKKRNFLKNVREKIYTNKRYPPLAKRRNIQGRVHVIFDILANGEATNIRIDESSRILKKEVRRSIRKSFPIDIPPSIASLFPMRNISINIDFKLQ
jgi:protein TonB